MLRFLNLLPFIAGSMACLTVSSAMAESQITVYGSKSFDERNVGVPTHRLVLKPGETAVRKLSEKPQTIHVANPDLADVLPVNDTTVLLIGKAFGETDIDILGAKSEPIAKFFVSVVEGPARNITLAPHTSTIRSFAEKIKKANVADPEVADVYALGDSAIRIDGKMIGDTEITVFGGEGSGQGNFARAEPLARFYVSVTEYADKGERGDVVAIHDGKSISDRTNYWCFQGAPCVKLH
jgi:Flp pilus assembly secretin CpaC